VFHATLFSQTSGVDPLAPTHDTKSAAEIDHEWQVSVSKYDGARAALLREVDRQDNDGPYRADWETLRKFEMPQWYKDAKFGIFIHWGVLAVSGAVNEWYPRNMYQESDPAFQEHRKLYGPQDKFGYKDLVPAVQGGEVGSGRLGAAFQGSGSAICDSGRGASRRLRAI
jgi:alpha-L-fucosidase